MRRQRHRRRDDPAEQARLQLIVTDDTPDTPPAPPPAGPVTPRKTIEELTLDHWRTARRRNAPEKP